jgi:hypothetical protein
VQPSDAVPSAVPTSLQPMIVENHTGNFSLLWLYHVVETLNEFCFMVGDFSYFHFPVEWS